MRLIDADPIEKFIENGLNCKDPKKRFGHDAIEILTEVHYAPTVGIDMGAVPNPPLTLKELQDIHFEPIWVEKSNGVKRYYIAENVVSGLDLYCGGCGYESFSDYGKTWIAYRHKPEEGTK